MNYRDLTAAHQEEIQQALQGHFYQRFDIDEHDEFFSASGMRYGYIAINERNREILVCDCTPDDGDTLIRRIRY